MSDEIENPFLKDIKVSVEQVGTDGNTWVLLQERPSDGDELIEVGLRGQVAQLARLPVDANQFAFYKKT